MYRRILVPVDGSDTSNHALLAALEVAGLKGGQLRLVHGLQAPVAVEELFGEQARQALRTEGLAILQRALAIADAAEVAAETGLLELAGRRLGEVVADQARSWRADLIVVGTHGRRGVRRAVLGSDAEQIVRLAPVPVLVVPGAAAAA